MAKLYSSASPCFYFRRRFEYAYKPIAERYDAIQNNEDQISHGDLMPANIRVAEKNGREYFIIDPKIKIRQPVLDVASLVTSPGVGLDVQDWEMLVMRFREALNEKRGYEPHFDIPLLSRLLGNGRLKIPQAKISKPVEEERRIFGISLMGAVHEPLKKIGKARDTQRFFPEKYEEWISERSCFKYLYDEERENIKKAIDELIADSEEYGVEKGRFVELRKLLFDEQWIFPEDSANFHPKISLNPGQGIEIVNKTYSKSQ
jgi:hypothetical protein